VLNFPRLPLLLPTDDEQAKRRLDYGSQEATLILEIVEPGSQLDLLPLQEKSWLVDGCSFQWHSGENVGRKTVAKEGWRGKSREYHDKSFEVFLRYRPPGWTENYILDPTTSEAIFEF
jgi:hypothetical protein